MEFVIPVIVTALVVITLSIIFKGKGKVDRGFKINYFKLSYRRKMIRTLITFPILILLLIIIYFYTEWSMLANVLFGLLFLTAFLGQLIYNYKMWLESER